MPVRFGDLTLDTERRQLRRAASVVHLTPKAFDLLAFLVESRPKALAKEAIQDRLWPDALVTESTLTSLVTELRGALGDDARKPRYVRTVPRFGYAFCGEAAEETEEDGEAAPAPVALHRVVWEGRDLLLGEGANVVGREPGADVWIAHDSVSRRHARIVVAGEAATLEDLGSKNATYHRGARVEAPVALADGDEIRFGWTVAVYRRVSALSSTVTRAG